MFSLTALLKWGSMFHAQDVFPECCTAFWKDFEKIYLHLIPKNL